ncbi:hypothetical protein ACFL96_17815, partial [Thermoproteota archaeon]
VKTDEDGNLVAEFMVGDIACYTANCFGRCSGISKVEFKSGSTVLGTFSNATEECTLTASTPLNVPGSETKEYSICMIATDIVGQTSDPSCKPVMVDKQAPKLEGNPVIIDTDSQKLETTKGEPIDLGNIKFNLTEHVSIEEVKVDLIGFDTRPEVADLYKGKPGACSGPTKDNLFRCTAPLKGLHLMINSSSSLKVRIYARDKMGNELNTTVDYPITYDVTPPEFIKIESDYIDENGLYWVNASGFELRAYFHEAGAGMSNRWVSLDMSSFGPQAVFVPGSGEGLGFGTGGEDIEISSTTLRPNTCEETDNTWVCTWKYLQATAPSGSHLPVSIKRAADDAGNLMTHSSHGLFSLDSVAPKVLFINETPLGETGLGVIGEGDMLIIKAYVQDHTPVTATANFSGIVDMESLMGTAITNTSLNSMAEGEIPDMFAFDRVEGECEEFALNTEEDLAIYEKFGAKVNSSQRIYVCTWETEPVLRGYHAKALYKLRFKDLLNNRKAVKKEITIYRKLNETEMEEDYWTLTTENYESDYMDGYLVSRNTMLHPKAGFDRFMWPFASQPATQEFILESSSNVVELLEIIFGPERCHTGLEYLAIDDETGASAIEILGYDDDPISRHDLILMMTNPASVPEVSYEVTAGDIGEGLGVADFGTVGGEAGTTDTSTTSTTTAPVTEPVTGGEPDTTTVAVNSINISCQMGVIAIVRIGADEAITAMEVKNFTIEIPVYGNPLGQNLENIKDIIDDIQDDVEHGAWKWMTTLRKIFEYMQAICKLFGVIFNVFNTFVEIKTAISGARNAGEKSGIGASYTAPLRQEEDLVSRPGVVADEALDKGLLSEIYAVLCGLLVECRMTQGGCDGGQESCGEDGWCKFRCGWYAYNQLWMGWMNDIMLTDFGWKHAEGGTKGIGLFNNADFDPKRSLYSSIFTGCLPGIIMNIEKQRQMMCQKLICYKVEVAQGTPTFVCDETYARNTCIHWVGQIFMAIPIFQYIEGLSNAIQEIIAQPWVLIGMAPEIILSVVCLQPEEVPGVCMANKVIRWTMDIANSILTVVDVFQNWKYLGIDWCEQAVKDQPDISKVMP